MASTNAVQPSFQQPFQCKECGLVLNSAESLEVHLQYHQENLMQQWAVKAQAAGEEKNNNMTKSSAIKREFSSSNSINANDNSDIQKKSPEYNRTSPEGIYGHPPTPQSYQSASSPYQNNDNSAFSPNYQNYPIVKSEGTSPGSQQQSHYQNAFQTFSESQQQQQQQFYPLDTNSPYSQDMQSVTNKAPTHGNNYRFHPYAAQNFDRSKTQTSQASPAYPPQPTPSPSPKQCDKCGFICETAAQLIEHNNLTHSANAQTQNNHNYMFDYVQVKEEDVSQSEILDLDSHKVVHPVWTDGKEEEKRNGAGESHPHSVSAIMNSWPSQQHHMFQGEHNMFMSDSNMSNMAENKMFPADQKIFQPPQITNQNYMNNGVTSTSQEINTAQQSYRQFDHLPTPPSSVIPTPQVPQVPNVPAGPPTAPTSTKSANWKSNEARRPKTYNCTACNKWFTSSGHLKRHYNTTLHKNAVKSSGQPDPASLPISAHHHPAREPSSNKEENSRSSRSPGDDPRSEDSNGMGSQFDNRLSMPGLLPHSPNGLYERQGGPNMHHTPPLHSPLGHGPLPPPSPLGGMMPNSSFSSLSNGSSPNGDAGLSSQDSRGLLSMAPTHGFGMMSQPHMMPSMEASPYQMYPNELAPHVTQATAINNLNIIGEYQFVVQENQRLPSFEQIQVHRFNGGFVNVGGLGPATAPLTYYTAEQIDQSFNQLTNNVVIKEEDDELKLVIANDSFLHDDNHLMSNEDGIHSSMQYSPTNINNNNNIKMEMNHISEESNLSNFSKSPGLVISGEPLGDSKENYEAATSHISLPNPRVQKGPKDTPNQEEKSKCLECNKVFNRSCYLTQHNKNCHDGEKPFKCSRCGKRYATEEIYESHLKKHTDEKPFKCEICPKTFNHKTDLRRHMCCHTGSKPYSCETCGKGFIRKDHMVKHRETHLRKSNKQAGIIRH